MVTIRRANPGDAEEIARIAAAGWRHAYQGLISPEAIEDTLQRWYSKEAMLRRLTGPPLHVVEHAEKVMGYVQHGPLVGGSVHEVYALYVEPSMIGQGIGWALWQQVGQDGRGEGCSAIELWVLDGNRLGIDWYNRQGGYVVGRREIELADGAHREIRYRFDLRTG